MAKIIINGKSVECQEGTAVLKVAIDAGVSVPFYCFHPALKVVASCRLCLMEVKGKDPKTGAMAWSSRLQPSCQTPAKDGMEVRFDSDNVRQNQRAVMEDYLLNHPLDCPVCDQSGECWLQDYSFKYGHAVSRMIEPKVTNPKKSVGSKTLLYMDRCVLCSRCVRFCREIAGTSELCVTRRGAYAEIDAFPGMPLENKLQGNVVDICPVGALLDKDFLFKERVWYLRSGQSVCPHCSQGCTIRVDHNAGRLRRITPRYNPKVNTWFMCDEGRFGWKYVHARERITAPTVAGHGTAQRVSWESALAAATGRLQTAAQKGGKATFVVLSPWMTCEEAWLLIQVVRAAVPQAQLVLGPVPTAGADELFPIGQSDPATAKFIIRAEKCPNRQGVLAVMKAAGGAQIEFDAFLKAARAGQVSLAWVVGGYPQEWVTGDIGEAIGTIENLIVQDILPSVLTQRAAVVLPSCAWVQREGTFINQGGLAQPIDAVMAPPVGCQTDGQYLYRLAGLEGLYRAGKIREQMAGTVPQMKELYSPPPETRLMH